MNVFQKIKAIRARRLFLKKVIVNPSTLTLIPGAKCNNSGSKNEIVIDEHCTLGCTLQALCGGKIHVGKRTYIGPSTILQSKESINIGNYVIIANNVLIVDNNNHPVEPEMRMKMSLCDDFLNDELWTWKYSVSKPIVIEDNVWIGRDSRILKGVTIGKGAVIAMGSMVTKDVPRYSVVAGNPAKVVKYLVAPEDN